MQLSWRRPAPRELDYELLLSGISIGGLGAGALWFALHLPWPHCAFRALTGLPCVTCGATRSLIQLLHGHFLAAWTLNPLAFLALCATAAFDLYALAVLTTRAPRLRIGHFARAEKNFARILVIALLASNWIYLLVARPN